ncbi:CPBP family intramembrane metalloprotease [Patescibacteria group bacterium]|nr:CPBP family intramembrane metalloprotease [Patescibacteria group bacterium]
MTETRFEFQDFVRVFALNIVLFAVFSYAFQAIPGATDLVNSLHPAVSFIFTYLIQFVVLFFPLWIFVIEKYSANLSDFGLVKVSWKKVILTIILSYISYLLIAYLITFFFFSQNVDLPGYQQQDSYIPLFGTDTLGFTVAVLVIVFIAPIIEEFFFRGFVYRVFTKTWPIWFGSIMTAILFSLIHFQFDSFLPILLLGIFLNYTYQRTGSIWTSIGFHALNNAIAFGLDVYIYFHPELLKDLELITGLLYNIHMPW